ncbi:hypothetical protein N7478_007132 [Penicillium angulare]|uniref:uncharacterized protein n=1 Tax=Penicillium angulare TaxID=116970 RepID=UPI00254169DC|nr:uncharacterized protein N7478_007132 [Penicillium angulare]KAJ5281760.1 hypothetical protein N7478_007132 [Penicillium angulare]
MAEDDARPLSAKESALGKIVYEIRNNPRRISPKLGIKCNLPSLQPRKPDWNFEHEFRLVTPKTNIVDV